MVCEEARDVVETACAGQEAPPYTDACMDALRNYYGCQEFHRRKWKSIEKDIAEIILKIKAHIEEIIRRPWPWPLRLRLDIQRSIEVRGEIFDDIKKAMIFSEHLEKAFGEAGIELKDDEAFGCLVVVTEKPKYISDVITPASEISGMETRPRVEYIMGPKIMKQVMEALYQDTIKYETIP